MIRKRASVLAGCAVGLLLAAELAAQTTAEPLFSAGADTLGNPLSYPSGSAPEISGAVVEMPAGTSTGWHRHRVPTFAYLLSGELSVEYETGARRVFRAGDGVVEALHVVHNGHNLGATPVRMVVFHAGAVGVPTTEAAEPSMPEAFVDLQSVVPGIAVELRYFGADNFVGRPIAGYEAARAYLTRAAAAALVDVQQELAAEGIGLKVFDAYRPQRAVDAFMAWADEPGDSATKPIYYPAVAKSDLVPKGYIAERSGHSRGSTVDLTLIDAESGAELDMGSPYDYFDPISWPDSEAVPAAARRNRDNLRDVMLRHGFQPLAEEWWHFTLRDEPYPDTYFDFPVR